MGDTVQDNAAGVLWLLVGVVGSGLTRRWEREGGAGLVAVVDPAGEDGVGSRTDGGVLLIAGGYLAKTCLGDGEDIVRELKLGKIADDCEPNRRSGDVKIVSDGGVNLFVMKLRVRDSVNGADEAFGCLVGTVEEYDDCGGNSWMLGAEAYKIEHHAGAYRAYGIFAFEISDER
jgi:hypothetical protein